MVKLTYSHRLRFLCACTRWHVLRSLAERHAMAAPGHPRRPPAAHSSRERRPLDSRGGMWAARRGVACGSGVRKVDLLIQEIHKKKIKLESRIALLKKDSTFITTTMAISIVIFAMYISLKMKLNTDKYTDMLYSGSLFYHSRCI